MPIARESALNLILICVFDQSGTKRTAKEVKDLVKSLDIQIDNLCQFLPQDRVASFAKLNEFEVCEAFFL